MTAPLELSHPILQLRREATHTLPTGPVTLSDWSQAGVYEVDSRSGSMHGKPELVRIVRYGADDAQVFLQIEFTADVNSLGDLEIQISPDTRIRMRDLPAVEKVVEFGVPFRSRFCLSFRQDGLPVETIPPVGEFALRLPHSRGSEDATEARD